MISFEDLPKEVIIGEIYSRLSKSDLLKCRLLSSVCCYYAIDSSLWRPLFIQRFQSEKKFEDLVPDRFWSSTSGALITPSTVRLAEKILNSGEQLILTKQNRIALDTWNSHSLVYAIPASVKFPLSSDWFFAYLDNAITQKMKEVKRQLDTLKLEKRMRFYGDEIWKKEAELLGDLGAMMETLETINQQIEQWTTLLVRMGNQKTSAAQKWSQKNGHQWIQRKVYLKLIGELAEDSDSDNYLHIHKKRKTH